MHAGHAYAGTWSSFHLREYISSHRQIAFAELFAVLFALHILAPAARNHSIICLVDNAGDVAIVNRQSTRSARLSILLRAIYDLSFHHHFSLRAQHIAGTSNILGPDFLSRSSLHEYSFSAQWSALHPHAPPLHSVSVVSSSMIRITELHTSSASASQQLSTFSRN